MKNNKKFKDGVFLPSKLTAENGAKALLSGEFFEEVEIPNEEYCGCGNCDYCYDFPETEPTYIQKVPISWTNVKNIYHMIVSNYSDSSHSEE